MSTRIIAAANQEEFVPFLIEIYKRAAADPEFRQLVLNDAKAAFDAVGADLGDWNLKFIEPGMVDADDVLMLPPVIEAPTDLTEEELEAVAGGAAECPVDSHKQDSNLYCVPTLPNENV